MGGEESKEEKPTPPTSQAPHPSTKQNKQVKDKSGAESESTEQETIKDVPFDLGEYDLFRQEHDYKKLLAQMKHLCQQQENDQMEIDVYCDMYREWTKNMQNLGSCVSIAFQDLEDKRENILDNREYYLHLGFISTGHDEFKYLMPLIDMEIETELHKVDWGMSRKDLEIAYKKLNLRTNIEDDFEIEGYWSTCQTMVVAEWFWEFLDFLYEHYTTTDVSMAQMGKDCYAKVLAHKHNWFMRTTVNLAINLINSRETFEENMLKEQTIVLGREYTLQEFHEDMREMSGYIKKTYKYIYKFNRDRKVENLI